MLKKKKQAELTGMNVKSPKNYMQEINVENSMYMEPTDENEIKQILTEKKNKFRSGYDKVSSMLLKRVTQGITFHLRILINKSI